MYVSDCLKTTSNYLYYNYYFVGIVYETVYDMLCSAMHIMIL